MLQVSNMGWKHDVQQEVNEMKMKRIVAVFLLMAILFVAPGFGLAADVGIPQLISHNGRTFTVALEDPELQEEYPVNLEETPLNGSEYRWGFTVTDGIHYYEVSTMYFKFEEEPKTIRVTNMQTNVWEMKETSGHYLTSAEVQIKDHTLVWTFDLPEEADLAHLRITYVQIYTPERSHHYYTDIDISVPDAGDDLQNGSLKMDDDGIFRYYEDDVFTAKSGIVSFEGGKFFLANGLICTDANGLAEYGGQWYFLAGGQIQTQYTGLALYDGHWFFVTNGIFNPALNGLVDYDDSKFIVAAGEVIRGVNGLWQNTDGVWYYMADSQVVTYYTGLVQYDGAWFYVINGRLATEYTGPVEYDGSTFQVVGGQVIL